MFHVFSDNFGISPLVKGEIKARRYLYRATLSLTRDLGLTHVSFLDHPLYIFLCLVVSMSERLENHKA